MLTKRGPGVVRHLIYLATLRVIEANRVVRVWYRGRASWQQESKLKAVVAVMRKLVRALWHVARGAEFDATKLFDVRRLQTQLASGDAEKDRRPSKFRRNALPMPSLANSPTT